MSTGNDRASSGPLLIAEPRFRGVSHAAFNAAALEGLRLATREPVALLGDRSHLQAVEAWRRACGATGACGEIVGERIPASHPFVGVRLVRQWRFVRRLLATARRLGARRLVLLSASTLQLELLARALPRRGAPAIAVIVHQLAHLGPPPGVPSRRADLERTLLRAARTGIRPVALSPAFVEELRRDGSPVADLLAAAVPGTLVPASLRTGGDDSLPAAQAHEQRPVRIGLLGGGVRASADALVDVVARARTAGVAADFVCVGRLHPSVLATAEPLVEGAAAERLPMSAFAQRLAAIDYALWMGDPAAYRLRVTASLLDCIAAGKPFVFRETPFVQHALEGGEWSDSTCAGPGDAVARLAAAAAESPAERALRRERVLGLRERFQPERFGAALLSAMARDGGAAL